MGDIGLTDITRLTVKSQEPDHIRRGAAAEARKPTISTNTSTSPDQQIEEPVNRPAPSSAVLLPGKQQIRQASPSPLKFRRYPMGVTWTLANIFCIG